MNWKTLRARLRAQSPSYCGFDRLSKYDWIEQGMTSIQPVISRIPGCSDDNEALYMRLFHCHCRYARPDVTERELAFSHAIRAMCLVEAGHAVTSQELRAAYQAGERPGVVSSIFGDHVPLAVPESIRLIAINLCPPLGELMHEYGLLSASPYCILAAMYFLDYAAANFQPLPFGRRQARECILRSICAWRVANHRDYGLLVGFLMDRKKTSTAVDKLLRSPKLHEHASERNIDLHYSKLREALSGMEFLPQVQDEGATS